MAKDPFKEEIDNIDQEQRAFVMKAVGLPEAIKQSVRKERKKPSKLTNGISGLFNTSLVSGAVLATALGAGILEKEDLNLSSAGICRHSVTDEGVNVRTGPSTGFDSVLQLENDSIINIVGYTPDANGRDYMWAQVEIFNNGEDVVHFIREDNITSFLVPTVCRTLKR